MEENSGSKKEINKFRKMLVFLIAGLSIVLVLLLAAAFLLLPNMNSTTAKPSDPAAVETQPLLETAAASAQTEPSAESEVTEPTVDPQVQELLALHTKNPDVAGWITIPDTVIDYPVMYTPEEEQKYLYRDMYGNFDAAGCLFVDDNCSVDPESDALLIHGHNMKNGTMFASLLQYQTKEYWQSHPTIIYTNLNESREYEVLAAFYDRVYYKFEDCFKYYQFTDAKNAEDFAYAISQFQAKALYDTDVSAEYGDHLLTLSTCAYHVEDGRFVVVARTKP